MGGLALIGILASLFYLIVLPILVFMTLSRGGDLKEEVEFLKRHLAAIDKRLTNTGAQVQELEGPEPTPTDEEEVEQEQAEIWEVEEFPEPTVETAPSPSATASTSAVVAAPPIFLKASEPEPVAVAAREPEALTVPALTPATVATDSDYQPPPRPSSEAHRRHEAAASLTEQQAAPLTARPQWQEHFFAWCIGGNPLVRVGILILFFGVSFLLKLAANHGWLPLELRLAGIALGAAAMLAIGWRLREKRRNYGLLLQGGGVGILYLVIYAAFAYFKLIPPQFFLFVFLLLFAICALSAFLAVRQDASALAVMGMTGGFAAPVLISSGGGNHIALFSYFALLNAGVLGIAWFRAWRALNLLGFAFTFGVGSVWGVQYYTPAHLYSVECFLILFFLFYVTVALLYAIRSEEEMKPKRYFDGTLVFGAPIAFSLLQRQVIGDIEFAMAWSALALGAFYLLLAAWLARYRLARLRFFFEAMLALGVLFLTLAVPLAFEGTRLTAAIWAVEGAGLCWIAVRQRRWLALASGLALQIFAAVSFYLDPAGGIAPQAPLALNSWYLGTLMLSLSAFFCGWRLNSDETRSWPKLGAFGQLLSYVLTAAGLLWWLGSGGMEIRRCFGPLASASYAYLLFAVLTAWFAHWSSRFLRWPVLEWVALALSPALLLTAGISFALHLLPLTGRGLFAWPLAAVLAYALLFQQERHMNQQSPSAKTLGPLHALMFWAICLVAGLEFHHFVASCAPEGVWQWSSWALTGALLLLALTHIGPRFAWPVRRFRDYYLTLGAAPLALLLLGWTCLGFANDGNPAPLPYLPFFNPLELGQLLVLATLFSWGQANRESLIKWSKASYGQALVSNTSIDVSVRAWLLAGAMAFFFLFINTVLLRSLHHWLQIPYQFDALYASTVAQAALSLLWSSLALIVMVWAIRRAQRLPWFVGISLLVLTVAKLFFVELARIAGAARIFSFIGVGLLLLLIGYLAPLPPKKKKETW